MRGEFSFLVAGLRRYWVVGLLGCGVAGSLGYWVAGFLSSLGRAIIRNWLPRRLICAKAKRAHCRAPVSVRERERVALLLQINFHLADGGLAVLFLGDLLELSAAAGRNLAD